MKVVEVIPLKKSAWKESLTYFSAQDIKVGDLVTIPLRSQSSTGLVVSVKSAQELKMGLKSGDWTLKKISKINKTNYFDSAVIEAIKTSANYFALQPGQILSALSPQSIWENENRIKFYKPNSVEPIIPEVLCLQDLTSERLARYKSLIRESFAKKQSIFICLPTLTEIEKISKILSKGIENYTFIGHGNLSSREQFSVWVKALELKHPILMIGTPLFLSLPREDISTVVIERENSPYYKTFSRPHFDWRFVIEEIAKAKKWRLILGDDALRSETIYRLGKRELGTLGTIKYRFINKAKNQLIPLQQENKNEFSPISQRLKERLENALDNQEKIFIYSGQRGVAPLTICRDCGLVMTCEVCGSTLAIHQTTSKKNERVFVCHKCSQLIDIEDDCRRCGGQRLAVIGFGVEKVIEELTNLFPQTTVFRLDSDTAKTNRKIKEIVNNFKKTSSSILVGTDLALNQLEDSSVENVIALSLDNLLALPDWRASEKLFTKLLQLKQVASKNFIIQTRQPEEKIFDYAITGNLIDFYRDEIAERNSLGYPPFKVLIKISLSGNGNSIKKEMANLEKILTPWSPLVYPSLNKNKQGSPVINLLIRLPAEAWPEEKLLNYLRQLPPNFDINIDPLSVL